MKDSNPPRRRACEACHVLKAKCDPNPEDPTGKCERCHRLSRDCVPAPRKLQRDRIAELEAQVEELSRALREQNLASSSSDTTPGTSAANHGEAAGMKKRKLSDQPGGASSSGSSPASTNQQDVAGTALEFLDSKVSYADQYRTVQSYTNAQLRVLPLVALTVTDLDYLRLTQPLLLLCIHAFAVSGTKDHNIQLELVGRAMHEFSTQLIASGSKSLELVQALLLAAFYYRRQPELKHASLLQIISLAQNMAIDIGIAGSQISRDPGVQPPGVRDFLPGDVGRLEARRTWLSCFVATSAMTTVMRRADVNPWTPYHDECLLVLETFPELQSDRMLCQIVRAERMCQKVANTLSLNDSSHLLDWADSTSKMAVSSLRAEIEDWSSSIPADLASPVLLVEKHIALINLNEPVLHTATNKAGFSAPYSDRVEASNFANPAVTVSHVAALYTLKDSCHAVLDLAVVIGPDSLLAVSSLFYTPRIAYALFILLKLYAAITAPGNTYGAVLDRSELRLEHHFRSLKRLSQRMMDIDNESFNSKIVSACNMFEEWLHSYNGILEQFESKMSRAEAPPAALPPTAAETGFDVDPGMSKDFVGETVLEVDDAWLDELWSRQV